MNKKCKEISYTIIFYVQISKLGVLAFWCHRQRLEPIKTYAQISPTAPYNSEIHKQNRAVTKKYENKIRQN